MTDDTPLLHEVVLTLFQLFCWRLRGMIVIVCMLMMTVKRKPSMMLSIKETHLWDVIEMASLPGAREDLKMYICILCIVTVSVRNMKNLKTSEQKGLAWILASIQKQQLEFNMQGIAYDRKLIEYVVVCVLLFIVEHGLQRVRCCCHWMPLMS